MYLIVNKKESFKIADHNIPVIKILRQDMISPFRNYQYTIGLNKPIGVIERQDNYMNVDFIYGGILHSHTVDCSILYNVIDLRSIMLNLSSQDVCYLAYIPKGFKYILSRTGKEIGSKALILTSKVINIDDLNISYKGIKSSILDTYIPK